MIYTLLKAISKQALKIYFRKTHVSGKENIPENGPYILVANHPSTFLDPINIGALVNAKVSFLAKGVLFKNKIVAAVLKKMNMIPIYRTQDNPNLLGKNVEIFKNCYEKLAKGGVIMIFPEGTSEMERKLRKIKSGTARIALGAEKSANFNLNLKIIPVGLSYTKESKFRSEVFINVGKTILVKEFQNEFIKNEFEASKMLTTKIEESLKDLIVDAENDELENLITKIESLYQLNLNDNNEKISPKESIIYTQNISKAVKFYYNNFYNSYTKMETKINNYFKKLELNNLSDKGFNNDVFKLNIFTFFIALVGFPIWIFGYINSFIPYKIPRIIALKLSDSKAFYGALLMAIGTFVFLFFYILEIGLVWLFTHQLILTIIYGFALPLTGIFTIYYARFIRKMYYSWKYSSILSRKSNVIKKLKEERTLILNNLEDFKVHYLQTIDKDKSSYKTL